MSILVIGSCNADLIARVDRVPNPGETLIGNEFGIFLGGKGANQAFAARRMGANVKMVGALGSDSFKDMFINAFNTDGIDYSLVKIVAGSSGASSSVIDKNGENRIIVIPGANYSYEASDLYAIENEIRESELVILQEELQLSVVMEAIRLAGKHKKRIIFNPAPAKMIDEDLFKYLYLITPNETELELLTGTKCTTMADYIKASNTLLNKGVENVVVTLGAKGSLLVNKNGGKLIDSFKVNVLDTLGAGDSFTGALGAMLVEGYKLEDALVIASAVAALEITKPGGIPAMPYRKDVKKFLKESNVNIEL